MRFRINGRDHAAEPAPDETADSGQLEGVIVSSPVANALVRDIDDRAARRHPGVLGTRCKLLLLESAVQEGLRRCWPEADQPADERAQATW